MHRALREAAKVFDVLRSLGLNISADKSHVLLSCAGTAAQGHRRQVTHQRHGQPHVCLDTEDGLLYIPISRQAPYLGAALSYSAFETYTAQSRLEKATAQYRRLARFLTGKNMFPKPKRVQVWRTCVWSTMAYSLDCLALTPTHIADITKQVLRQLRAVQVSQAHLHHTSDDEVLAMCGRDPEASPE
jgi:hypothetical protein